MRTLLSVLLAAVIAGLMVACPIAYQDRRSKEFRNFRVVEDGVLYRSGQMPIANLQRLVRELGIRTVVCLRNGDDPVDKREEDWVNSRALHFVRIPPLDWNPDVAGNVPAETSVRAFHDVMDDPANYPVLVHCFAGIHRTGTMCALFRIDYQNWTNEEAMAEMRTLGYSLLDAHHDVRNYLTNYSPRRKSAAPQQPFLPVRRQKDDHP
jgi:protein tyrosine/serine phosphatase